MLSHSSGRKRRIPSLIFRDALEPKIAIVFEPSARDFAAMISNCDLFVTCDSGPMHLACGLGIRTVAIFQNPNFDHWGPPSSVARIRLPAWRMLCRGSLQNLS